MTIYSFYIFDRHCECIYIKQWHEQQDHRPLHPSSTTTTTTTATSPIPAFLSSAHNTKKLPLPPDRDSTIPPSSTVSGSASTKGQSTTGRLSIQDDAKLIFGVVFSLRNMVRKLSGPDDSFISYRTNSYKLHFYETPTNLRFVMLTDIKTNNLRIVLHQIYVNLYVEYVVKNPLSPAEHPGGEGVAVELFELGLDQFVRTIDS